MIKLRGLGGGLKYDFRTSDKFCRGEIRKFSFTLKRQTKVFSHFLSFQKSNILSYSRLARLITLLSSGAGVGGRPLLFTGRLVGHIGQYGVWTETTSHLSAKASSVPICRYWILLWVGRVKVCPNILPKYSAQIFCTNILIRCWTWWQWSQSLPGSSPPLRSTLSRAGWGTTASSLSSCFMFTIGILLIMMVVPTRIEFWKAEETPSFICSSHRALLTSTTGLQVLLSPPSSISPSSPSSPSRLWLGRGMIKFLYQVCSVCGKRKSKKFDMYFITYRWHKKILQLILHDHDDDDVVGFFWWF